MKRSVFEFETKSRKSPTIFRLKNSRVDLFPENSTRNVLVMKRQDPPMEFIDELIYLLHTTAEIEHSLMVQYLYAGYSLTDPAHKNWHDTLVGIAREEMSHLMSVQNMLLAIGAPLNFEREDYPFNSLYPFHFELEPVSVKSLAKYVLAEMPDPQEIPDSLGFDLNTVRADAKVTEGNSAINRVGTLFSLLAEFIESMDEKEIQQVQSQSLQADPTHWQTSIFKLILTKVQTKYGVGDGFLPLIQAIGEQGEGPSVSGASGPSHFLRFFELYKEVKKYEEEHGTIHEEAAFAKNPTVYDKTSEGYIDNLEAKAWADVANHRYRWMLVLLQHYLRESSMQDKQLLSRWAFAEMKTLREISLLLGTLPQNNPIKVDDMNRPFMASLPFELPYSLALPSSSLDLWRYHKRLAMHGLEQMQKLPRPNAISRSISQNDTTRQIEIQNRINTP